MRIDFAAGLALAFISLAAVDTTAIAAPKTAQSKACSDAADKQGLHGKPRDAFRAKCMSQAAGTGAVSGTPNAAGAPAAPPAGQTMGAKTSGVQAGGVQKTGAQTSGAPIAGAAKLDKAALSKSCSDQANTRKLHGADRETFRAACMKGAAPTGPATQTAAGGGSKSKTTGSPFAPSGSASTTPAVTTPATTTPATTATTPSPTTPYTSSAGVKPTTPTVASGAGISAGQSRIKTCGAQWRTAKAAGQIPAGQTWPQYWSACDKQLKAKGL